MIDWFKKLAALGTVALVAACGGGSDDPPTGTLAAEASARGFTALVAAADKAGLVPALSSPTASLTVFAPTDDAFAAALAELSLSKAQLLASPDLAGILTYHVVAGDVRAADVVALPKPAQVSTVQGSAFTVDAALAITDGRGRTAGLAATDVVASNGVIHVIDKVLLPPAAP
ncbi:MAG: fasciclin domain-containing protein [Rubrivivax sp.]|nr:fasciclin domain-containing protein [Rubrivivax sp.]